MYTRPRGRVLYIRVFTYNESISSGSLNPVMSDEVIRRIITLYYMHNNNIFYIILRSV